MLHDKAFDIGIITVMDNMTVKVSHKHVSEVDNFFSTALLAYEGKSIALPEKFQPHTEFLAYHRENIFNA